MKGHFRGGSRPHRDRDGRPDAVRAAAAPNQPAPGSPYTPRSNPPCGRSSTSERKRRIDQIVAGLPAHVMDELVQDLAEAVVAMLQSQAAAQSDEHDDASGNLREI